MSNLSPATTTTARPLVPRRQMDIRSTLQSENVMNQVSLALPKGMDTGRFMRIVVTACNKNPKLTECDPQSILLSVMQAAAMGLECDGRQAHLIPRWNGKKNCFEAQFQSDYKGLVGLVRKNPSVSDVYAVNVFSADMFVIKQGLHRDLIHEEAPVTEDRGKFLGSYAVVQFKDGSASWEWMRASDIYAIRDRSDGWKAHVEKGFSTPWKTDEGEMAKKTVLKRLLKLADLSSDLRDRLDADDVSPNPVIPISLPASSEQPLAIAETAQPEVQAVEADIAHPVAAPEPEAHRKPGRPRKIDAPVAATGPAPVVSASVVVPEDAPSPSGADSVAQPDLPAVESRPGDPIREKLAEGGFSEEAMVLLARSYDVLGKEGDLDDMQPDMIAYCLQNWAEIEKSLK